MRITTYEELRNNMAVIHKMAATPGEPQMETLTEREVEIEFSFLQQEHYLENQTLDNFQGIEKHEIDEVIRRVRGLQEIGQIAGRPKPNRSILNIIISIDRKLNQCYN